MSTVISNLLMLLLTAKQCLRISLHLLVAFIPTERISYRLYWLLSLFRCDCGKQSSDVQSVGLRFQSRRMDAVDCAED
jgi:hypothetical protein